MNADSNVRTSQCDAIFSNGDFMEINILLGLSCLCILPPCLLHAGTKRLVRIEFLLGDGRHWLVVHLGPFHIHLISISTGGRIGIDIYIADWRGAGQGIIILIFLIRALLFGHHHGLDLGTKILRL